MRKAGALAALTLAVLLAGCTEKPVQPGGGTEPGTELRQVSFSAVSPVSWTVGDHVALFAGGGAVSDFTVKSVALGGKTAVLTGKVLPDPERTSISVVHPFRAGLSRPEDYVYELPTEQDPEKYAGYVFLSGSAEVSGDDFSDLVVKMEEHTYLLDVKIDNFRHKRIEAVRISGGTDVTARFSTPRDDASVTVRFVLLPGLAEEAELQLLYSGAESETFPVTSGLADAAAGSRLQETVTPGKGEYTDIVDAGWFCGEPFGGVPDIDRMKIYEVSPRIFAKENSLQAVRTRLSAIKELGANVIWLMPIFEQSEVRKPYGSPYSMKDFYRISPEYGTTEDLRALVEEAHSKGIAVILDFVTNHTGADCSWVSGHPSWYMEQYAPDYTDAALFKWNDPDSGLEAEMLHALEYWIHAANIDGYRFDSVSPTRTGGVTLDFFSRTLPELRRRCPGRKLIFLAESARPETLGAGFDLNYGWHFLDALEGLFAGTMSVANLFSTNTEEWDGVTKYGNATTTRMRYSTNHDHAATASPLENYTSLEGSLAAFVIASTMGGVPMIYSSQDIGYPTKLSIFKSNAKVMDWASGKSVSETYRTLFKLGDSTTLRKGSISRITNTDVVSFTRVYGGETILVLVNIRNATSSFSLNDNLYGASWKDYFTSDSFTFQSKTLAPYEYKVLVKQ